MKNSLIILVFSLFSALSYAQELSAEEMKLYNSLTEYRKENKLPAIPLSKSLTFVAQTHVKDLVENRPDQLSNCNLHSWSSNGEWTSCCYTSDHAKAACLWNKPSELTSYSGRGYEIAYRSSNLITANNALNSWKASSGHNAVILNEGKWSKLEWNAVGIGIYQNYAVIWFGEEKEEK